MKIKDFIKHLNENYDLESEVVNDIWVDSDIIEHAESLGISLSNENVTAIIKWLEKYSDAELGIDWDRIEYAIRQVCK